MAWIILPSVGELTSTGYGLALIVKVALVVVVIALGAFNRYRLVPAVDVREQQHPDDSGRSGGARRWLGNVVLAEFVLLIVAVGVTAVMVTRSPLSSVATAAPAEAPQTLNVTLGDIATADVTVTPARVGFNVVGIELRDPAGRVVNPYEAPVIEFALPSLDVGPLQPEVLPLGIGRYQATADLRFAGTWDLSIRVRFDEFESAAGTATVTIE
jgi:copper transport protein